MKKYIAIGLAALLGLTALVVVADEPLSLEDRVATLEALHGIDRSTPTATEVPPTATATSTAVPPTATAEPTATHDHGGEQDTAWHPPTDHEHGHAPPQWAEDWSVQQFGHGVIYGGDEQTPNENLLKHNAFKGQIVPSNAGGEAYVRYHGQSNPHGRAAQFHSYELYYLDTAGNVSFLQGWIDCGGNDARFPRSQGDPEVRPAMLVVDQAAWDSFIRTEQWYCHGTSGLVEIGVNIGNTTTIWHPGEHLNNPHDQSTWDVTGSLGNYRLVDFFLIEDRYFGDTGWFCYTAEGEFVDCDEPGALPQYVAPTFYDDMRNEYTVSRISGQSQVFHSCGGCALPN